LEGVSSWSRQILQTIAPAASGMSTFAARTDSFERNLAFSRTSDESERDNTERPRSLKLQWYPDSSQRHNTVIPFFWKLIETERETSHTVPLRPSPSLSCLSGTVTTLLSLTKRGGAAYRDRDSFLERDRRNCNSATPAELSLRFLSSEIPDWSGILVSRAYSQAH